METTQTFHVAKDVFAGRIDQALFREKLAELKRRLADGSTMFPSKLYAGHMNFDISEPHVQGFMEAFPYNQNQVGFESSPITTELEREFVVDWLNLLGWDPSTGTGYITLGGTFGNLEAIWIARNKARRAGKDPKFVLCSDASHYSIEKACDLLGLKRLPLENNPAIDPEAVAAVALTLGAVETGEVDDLTFWTAWCREKGVFCLVDGAYGSYFLYVKGDDLSARARAAFAHVKDADAFTFDPHKQGFAPYNAGGFLLKDSTNVRFCSQGSVAYVGLSVSSFTVEGTRPGSMAASTWLGQKVLHPLYPEMMQGILRGAAALKAAISSSEHFKLAEESDLGMVLFKPKGDKPPFSYLAGKFCALGNVQRGHLQLVACGEMFRVVVFRPDAVEVVPGFVEQLEREYAEYVSGYDAFIAQRLANITGIVEECQTVEELEGLLRLGRELVAYNGFEPSGRIHIAQAVITVLNANTLTQNGFRFIIYIADWFAKLNHKMDGDLEKIQTVGRYFVEVFKSCGLDMSRTEIIWASDLMRQETYWPRVLDIATHMSVARVQKTCQIMGRRNDEKLDASQIMYPCMQAADIFEMGVDCPQLGLDQRKVNMLARDYAEKVGMAKPTVLSHHMLIGLKGGDKKMSKSNPDGAIFMEDPESEVERKIKAAFCNDDAADGNPIFEYFKYILFRWFGSVTIGDVTYNSIAEFAEAFPKLDKRVVKECAIGLINRILEPVRQRFATGEMAKLAADVAGFRVTR